MLDQPESGHACGDADALAAARLEMAEMHHRFANVLQGVRSLLARRSRAAGEGCCRDALSEADAQIHAFALLHERLRRSAGENAVAGLPCCAAYLADVCRDLADACLEPQGVRLDFSASAPLPMPETACRNLGLLVTELVINASKHAFDGRCGGVVSVSLAASSGAPVRITVCDDGVGMSSGMSDRGGEGMGFVEMLARSVGASCLLSTGSGGTRYAFELGTGPAPAGTVSVAMADA